MVMNICHDMYDPQVLPDLVKFMDSVHNKMMSVHKMNGQLEIEAGGLPAAKELFG